MLSTCEILSNHFFLSLNNLLLYHFSIILIYISIPLINYIFVKQHTILSFYTTLITFLNLCEIAKVLYNLEQGSIQDQMDKIFTHIRVRK